MKDLTDEDLVRQFVETDAEKKLIKKKLESLIKVRDDKLEEIQAELLARMTERKQKNFRTTNGTVVRYEDMKPSAADWNVVYDWIMEDSDRFEFLHKRLSADAVKKWCADHKGSPPPGMNVYREFKVKITNKVLGEDDD